MENNALAALHDLHNPAAVSIFPLAPVWYVASGVLLCALIILALVYVRRRRRMRRIAAVEDLVLKVDSIAEVSIVLKRIARDKFSSQHPEMLFGDAWLAFLDQSGKTTEFTRGCGQILRDTYQANLGAVNPELYRVVTAWIRVVL